MHAVVNPTGKSNTAACQYGTLPLKLVHLTAMWTDFPMIGIQLPYLDRDFAFAFWVRANYRVC